MYFGLSKTALDAINAVFATHHGIAEAVIYGSRAMGTYRDGSDIDLTLKGAIDNGELTVIEMELDKLDLPWMMDVSLYDDLDNPELIEHIDRVGKTFYQSVAR